MTTTDRPSDDVDVKLLRDVLTFVTENRRVHEQGTWLERPSRLEDADAAEVPSDVDAPAGLRTFACNTVGCLAGWTALAVGFVPHWSGFDATDEVVPGPHPTPRLTRFLENFPVYSGRGPWPVAWVARAALGLDDWVADRLFDGRNTLRDLWEYAAVVSDGAIEVPTELRYAEQSDVNYRAILDES